MEELKKESDEKNKSLSLFIIIFALISMFEISLILTGYFAGYFFGWQTHCNALWCTFTKTYSSQNITTNSVSTNSVSITSTTSISQVCYENNKLINCSDITKLGDG